MNKHIMEEAIKDMRNKLCQLHGALCKYARGEKYAQLVVVMSWLIFALIVMVGN